jgi:drug/metabolite transporter (DMT)-like permease
MTPGIIIALASALAYGSADFVGGVGSRRYSSWQIVLIGQITGALVMFTAGLLLPGSPTAVDFGWALLAGVGSATGSIFLFRGLARGRMGLVAPVSAVGAATLPVLVGTALGERPSWMVWVGMLVAIPGIWLVSRDTNSNEAEGRRSAIVDGALAGAGFGLLFIALAQISPDAGVVPLSVNQLTGAILTVTIAKRLGQPWRPRRGVVRWGGFTGILGSSGTLAFTLASQTIGLGITAVLASLYPAVTVLLAATVLKERIGMGQRAGIGICTLAIAGLALG